MTAALWRSAFVAAVFAIHPLRAESVAWIAERKDVLSGVFFMLTLWAYARYAHQPSRRRYAAVALWYGVGLLCKNTLVTLPCVLLLLDWWPLQRRKAGTSFWRLVKEKIPLFILSAASCVMTALVPEKLNESDALSLLERIGNALVSYVIYLREMAFPAGLAIPYLPPPDGLHFREVAGAFVLLALISIVVVARRTRQPYLLVGWLWYLGMLVPAIGLVQISYYVRADRYTYLPGIGVALAGTWAVGDFSAGWRHRRAVLGGWMAAVIGVLMVCGWKETTYWKDSETLWNHTLAHTSGNYIALNNLGNAVLVKGRVDEAISRYQQALEIVPTNARAHSYYGNALLQKGRVDEALNQYQESIKFDPSDAEVHNNLGSLLLQKGRVEDSIHQFQAALKIKPDYAEAHFNAGLALFQSGHVDEAIAQYQDALNVNPDMALAQFHLGDALRQKGLAEQAVPHYLAALEIQPSYGDAENNLGAVLRQTGRIDEAIFHYEKAIALMPTNESVHFNLARALLQKGRAEEAIAQYQSALQIDPADVEVQNNLAFLLATCGNASLRDGRKAVELARLANKLSGGKNPVILGTLAAAFAETGRFDEAKRSAKEAIAAFRNKRTPDFHGR